MATLVRTDIVVDEGEVLTLRQNGNNFIAAAVLFGDGEHSQYEPNIINRGEIHLENNHDLSGCLIYFNSTLNWDTGVVENYGLISAVVPENLSARTLFGLSAAPSLYNEGTILAQASDDAEVYFASSGQMSINNTETGILSARSEEVSIGVRLHNGGAEILNDGLIRAVSSGGGSPERQAGIGIMMGAGGGSMFRVSIENNGLIQTADRDATTDLSVGIQLRGNGIGHITNSGVIRGDYAVWEVSEDMAWDPSGIELRNSGLLDGHVVLAKGDDLIVNSGRIFGNVDLGIEDDVYDGRHGLVTGTVHGGQGDDRVSGGVRAEQLFGDDGNDVLAGGRGDDALDGGGGVDTASYSEASSRVIVRLSVGQAQDTHGAGTDTLTSIENLVGSAFNDRLTGNGTSNRLEGGGGNDVLIGGVGLDVLDGGEGSDVYFIASAADHPAGEVDDTGAAGTDEVRYSATVAGTLTLFAADVGIERVVIGTGLSPRADSRGVVALNLDLRGLQNGVAVSGNSGVNEVTGSAFADQIRAGMGNDRVEGGGGADWLSGEAGNDRLQGGRGRDQLNGGLGADDFVFEDRDFAGLTASTCDRIQDFREADGDRISLEAVDANSGLEGEQAFTLIGTGAFSGVAGQLRYEQLFGNTYVQGDLDGDRVADFLIRVEGLHDLRADDFVF